MANNNRRRTIVIESSHSSEETVDSLKAAIVHLRSELDAEKKCIRRLRREKAYEVQLAREQERNKAAMSVKEMVAKLHQEKERETETLRCKHKTDIVKVMKQKDKEVNKIKKDLVKCQDDLKEEIFKRGLSASARAAFELERSKLLQEIKELNASKKQIEDALSSATEAEKQRTNELRLLQETSRHEIAKVNRDANIEIKRLLEELKAKDHAMAVMRGNHSTSSRSFFKCMPDNQSIGLAELVSLSKEIESWEKKFSTIGDNADVINQGGRLPNFSLQRKLYDIEKQLKQVVSVSSGFTEKNNELKSINKALEQNVNALVEHNNALNIEVKSAKGEIRRLNGLMTSTGINSLTSDLETLQRQLKDYENKIKLQKNKSKPKKTVRFLLPSEDHEVCTGDDSYCACYDGGGRDKGNKEEGGGGEEDELEMLDSSGTTAPAVDFIRLWRATTFCGKFPSQGISQAEFDTISVGENPDELEALRAKHLEMENLYQQYKFLQEENHKEPADWQIQKESLRIVIQTLEDKLKRYEEDEGKLKLKVREVCDQNEELEFQILELENSTDEKKLCWQKENEMLKSELSVMKNRLMQYESNDVMERNVATQCDEEMLATNPKELQNPFHKLTDEYKLSLEAELEKNYLSVETGNCFLPQNLSNFEQKNHEYVSLHSLTPSESCSGIKITDVAVIKSKTKIGPEQGSASANCVQKLNEIVAKHLVADKVFDIKQDHCQNEAVSRTLPQLNASGCDGATGQGLMAHDICKDSEIKRMFEFDGLKRRLIQSQARERQMKDQLVMLEEEKNRQIKLLQQQIDMLEGPEINPTASNQTCLEMERPGMPRTAQAETTRGGPNTEHLMSGVELTPINGERNEEFYENRERVVKLMLDTTLNWIATPTDIFNSTPVSGDFNFCPNLEYKDSREEQLYQQISDLERDRDTLHEIIHKDESVICELQLEIVKLQQSERDLQHIIDRLERAEERMRRKADDISVQNDDMEKQIKELKGSESMLLSSMKKMRSTEFELKMKLEEMIEENRSNESTWKRRLSEVEIEKRLLQGKVKELDEQVGDLEGTELVLRQKIKKMEKLEIHMQKELEDVRRERNAATCRITDLDFEKGNLMQKLEKQNLDFTTELVHLKQEKEAMTVEMIEMSCRIKIFEQSLAFKEATISSVELKLYESELLEKELQRKLLAFETQSHLVHINANQKPSSGTNQKPANETVEFGSSELLELTGSDSCDDSCKDCHKGVRELVSSHCANDDQPVEHELGDEMSMHSSSLASRLSSGVIAVDDVESADEASEIIDEDDGAFPPPDCCTTIPDVCWQILAPSPCASFNHRNRLTRETSLDSINDSGLESLKQDGLKSGGHENSVCHERLSLTVKPNAYKHGNQSYRISLIPISVRYLTKNACQCSDDQNSVCSASDDTNPLDSQVEAFNLTVF